MSLFRCIRQQKKVNGLRTFASSARQNADFTHAVVGGGVVGLAVARRLQQHDGASVVLIEKHGSVGTETSSRNSEIIHAGLYYGADSLKARLCVEGKGLLYALCDKNSIAYQRTGKLVVAQDEAQYHALEDLHANAQALDVPTNFLSRDELATQEPDVRAEAGALLSPTTGILDSHGYMAFLQASFEENGGTTALGGAVEKVDAPGTASGGDWVIHVRDPSSSGGEPRTSSISASTLVNSAGLHAVALSNSILPASRHKTPYFARGTYFSYAARSPRPRTLVYPAPVPGHGGLGTHLTIDLNGKVRFGPDVQWTDDPTDYTPRVRDGQLEAAVRDINSYLPGLDGSKIEVDYCGIRPKLSGEGQPSADFYIKREEGFDGFVNLLGIESPGLTSSLAIAEQVWRLLYR